MTLHHNGTAYTLEKKPTLETIQGKKRFTATAISSRTRTRYLVIWAAFDYGNGLALDDFDSPLRLEEIA